jgi:hypothetical protein
VAAKGRSIYLQHQADLEKDHNGQFVVIDVDTGDLYVDALDIAALDQARKDSPSGRFYLLRIGFPAAYKLTCP